MSIHHVPGTVLAAGWWWRGDVILAVQLVILDILTSSYDAGEMKAKDLYVLRGGTRSQPAGSRGLSHLQFTWRTDVQAIIDWSPGWSGAGGRIATWLLEPRILSTVLFLLLIIEMESLLLVSSLWNWTSTALLSEALTNFAFLQSPVFISQGSLRC